MGADVLVPLTLVVGDEELLVSRAVAAVRDAARARDPQADVRDLAAATITLGDLQDLLTPSLFGDARVVIVRGAQDLTKDVGDGLVDYAQHPLDEVCLVVAHAGGVKGKRLVDALSAAGARRVDCPRLTRPAERLDFVRAELRAHGRVAKDGAVRALVDAVGNDLRELAMACSQLAADTTGRIDEDTVARYHRGKAEATGFVVADKAVEGDGAGALEHLRWALSVGIAPVLVSSALAASLRGIARVASEGRAGTSVVAKRLGLPPWRVERLQRQMRGWHPDGIAAALQAVAAADADVKGAGTDPAYALERAVLAIVSARAPR